jgi:predicted ATPase
VEWPATKPDQLALGSFGSRPPHLAIERMLTMLRGIEVHLPFDTRASWAARSYRLPESIRGSATHYPAERLNLLGFNLANAWSELRNQPSSRWEHTLSLLRLGMGERVDTVVTPPDMGGGNIYLAVRFTDLAEPVLASDLSDGQLAWLAFVAMARLNAGRSLLAVDEPELHLHPSLLGRVVALLAHLEGGTPALLSTHSDRVLEMLDDPAGAVRVLDLDGSRTMLSRLDPAELSKWLEEFGNLGQLRANGYLRRVIADPPLIAAEGAK